MIELTLGEIVEAVQGRLHGGDDGLTVSEVTTDSRDVPGGSVFIALRGETHDGHDHVAEALGAGALAYVAERRVTERAPAIVVEDTWEALAALGRAVRERVDPTVVALTGSVGKTTTKDLTAAAVGAGRRTEAARGSYNNEVGVPLTCLSATADTEVLVVEIGARGVGHISSLMPAVQPDVAIVTAVAAAHLEMFRDLDTVARAKGELVEALPSSGTAVLNADDDRVAAMATRTRASILTYSARGHPEADVVAHDIELDRLARPRFAAHTPWGRTEVRLPITGTQNVGNALAALAVAGSIGVDIEAAAAAIATAEVSDWRSGVDEVDGIVVLNDAYNANPASMRAALETLASVQRTGRTWAVLGVMAELGDHAAEAHEDIGRACVELDVDRLVVVGPQARSISAGAAAGGMAAEHLWEVEDAEEALEVIGPRIAEGDVVLVKASRVARLERVAEGIAETRR